MTPLQLKALDYIREEIALHGTGPTRQEMVDHLGLTGKSGAQRLVDALIEQGQLRRRPYQQRAIEVVDATNLVNVPTDALRAELARRGFTLDSLVATPRPIGGRDAPRCAHDSCISAVERGKLFCRPHWWALPTDIRARILDAFGRKDVDAYREAIEAGRDHLSRVG